MSQPVLLIRLSLAVLLSADVLAQNPITIQFQRDPVLIQTSTEILFTVPSLSPTQVFSAIWKYRDTVTVGSWSSAGPVVNPGTQFETRTTITANQLRIGNGRLEDAGSYTLEVIPSGSSGLTANSKSVQLRVFDPVIGVSLSVPSTIVENNTVSMSCTWTSGTEVTVQWSKGGVTITADSRITISGGSLVISSAIRSDAGDYVCNASNPASFQTATRSLTVYYGPDTPALTIDRPKQCVGGGDVQVGQTVRITCTSASLPAASFSWQRDGQPITGQPNTGVLTLQTTLTSESGQYVCIAENSITGRTSRQTTDLAVVDVCFDGGEVAGIVIGSFLGLLIIILLIILLIFLVRRRMVQQRRRENVFVQKTNPNQGPIPPDPQTNNVRDLDQGLQPPLFTNTQTRQPDHLIPTQHERRGNLQSLPLNGLHHSDTQQNNGRANRRPHNSTQNINSYPDNGIDNPAFTHAEAQNANALPNSQQQNPNVLIQTGGDQGANQHPAVQVSLNTLPQTNNSQIPTINVNLNSYPANSQQTQQDRSHPFAETNNNAAQMQLTNARQSNPTIQSVQSHQMDPRLHDHVYPDHQAQSGLIPTGYTHLNSVNTSQQNVNTQTYQQEPEPPRRSDRNSGGTDTTPRSTHRQMPWDRLRGTPAYPSDTFQTVHPLPEVDSDSVDYTREYTTHPIIREERTASRPQPQSQTVSRRRTPTRRDPPSEESEARSRSADRHHHHPNTASVPQHERSHHTQRNPHTQRESAQPDIRGSQTAPRQETTHSNNPQALPLMSQQASAGHSAVPRGPTAQQGLTAPQSADIRALADPNHLQQAHMTQQHIAAPFQTQGQRTHTQPAVHDARQPRQGGAAPVPNPSAQPSRSNLTQNALRAHTERAQVFENRRQQTQAALLHPGSMQIQAPAATTQRPPTPPPVMPLTQFQNLPKERNQHKSPTRGAQPVKRNIPATQRHLQQGPSAPRHATVMPTNQHHHHHHHTGHNHAGAHRHGQVRGHGHRAHVTNAGQQQAHRGRPR
ncbi:uncharacterized protein si:dkeyp-97a10.3 [Kryptolebias marmoratus]|uniref:Uncharacterized LOC108240298 n=1 Tax=Kryptolebias marmoratus TaxID=37003 RepID=A0A3Q3BM46_KRYMA|nr:uncharacterized protein si:dkeyp-97a10.3 [Kryptolebias marmoratus]XP_017279160.1 uncharacterized protein si:dkeyp-97a10.3 [Kryptolebias marmoratus]